MMIHAALVAFSLAGAEPLVIADFEEGAAPFSEKQGVKVTTEWAAHGKASLKVSSTWVGAQRFPREWNRYDLFKMECFNPSEKMIKLTIQIRDDVTEGGYWAWHNRYVTLAPGQDTVEFSVADIWRGEILRRDMGDIPFHTDKISALNIKPQGEIFIDHIRLEKAAELVKVAGMISFDFGPENSPVMPGFKSVTRKTLYTKEGGFGWSHDRFYRDGDRIHPDNLFRDWVSPSSNSFLIDLPAGEYVVHMQLEDPGYWEFYHWFRKRTVKAEGKTVLDETMDADEFLSRYFRFQDVEDTPWDETWKKYVERRHKWRSFRVKVEDGQLDLRFDSPDSYGNTVSALLVWPASSDADGREYLEQLTETRYFQWSQRWKRPKHERPPQKRSFSPAADRLGYVVFSRGPARDLNWDTRPERGEEVHELRFAAARGEDEPAAFAVHPLRPLGKVRVSVSDLVGPGGSRIPASAVDVRVGRYKNKRQGHQSGMYDVRLRLLSHFDTRAGNELVMDDMFTRLFWLTVSVPEDAPGGEYVGDLLVVPEHARRSGFALAVEVRPFELPEPDFFFSLYGIRTQPIPYYDEMKEHDRRMRRVVYDDLKRHGINYLGGLGVRANIEGGKLQVTGADAADREIALRKSLGFKQGTVGFRRGASARELASGKPIKGMPRDEFIRAWHLGLTEFARERGWPHPYFSFGDEPNLARTLNELAGAHKALHAVSPDIWTGIAYHVNPNVRESYAMRDTLDVHHLKSFCSDEEFAAAGKVGKFVLCCNPGSTRYAYGLREWKLKGLGVDGAITFAYCGNHVDIYYGLDGREDECGMAFPTRDGDLQLTTMYERLREGVDDFRYLQLAWSLSQRGGPGSREAKRYLEKVTARVPSGRHSRNHVPWQELDEMRERLSSLIGRMLGD